MSSLSPAPLSPVKQALAEIRRLRQRVAALEDARREPIAIVGTGLRFPGGARDAEQFHEQLCDGLDAISTVPPGRWDTERYFSEERETAGTMYTRHGGFLEDVSGFDPEFFGISPFEAATIDPQQRLLLEVVWEALENAGIAATSLRGSRTGVFLGIAAGDYGRLALADADAIDEYASLGTAFSVAAGRISYFLGLHGPAVSIDTACSASLVAMHLACQSLRVGESEVALAAGVNLILTPEITINFCRAGMLAADGRCKTFDANADGYVRSEGCGVVVLKRLTDAQRDGDRILAVVRGSAVNQDGRSSGITAPNGPAQEAVIRAALDQAGLLPCDIGYIEAHGTGTSLGDPIEMLALGNVFSADRPAGRPLIVGSVKTNVGHLEGAAGMAGLIKTVQALRHRVIPPHLHFRTPSPHIPWSDLPLEVPARPTAFEPIAGHRRAGISSFGFSGTNIHVILEEAPAVDSQASVAGASTAGRERPLHVLTLSATQPVALRETAERYINRLERATESVASICYTSNVGRTHLAQRLAVVTRTAAEAADELRKWIADTPSSCVSGARASDTPAIAYVCTGSNGDCRQVASLLQQTSPVVAQVLKECDAAARQVLSVPLLDVLDPASSHTALLRTPEYAHVAAFTMQLALSALWRAWGLEPDIVIAGAAGEYVAAHLAGVFELGDALRLVVLRCRALEAAAGSAERQAAIAETERLLRTLALRAPTRLRTVSAHTGTVVPPEQLASVQYWMAATGRTEERLDAAVRAARAEHTGWLIETSVRDAAQTTGAADPSLAAAGQHMVRVAAPGEGASAWSTLLDGVARLHVAGADVAWQEVSRGVRCERVDLPSYPFQRRSFWLAPRTRTHVHVQTSPMDGAPSAAKSPDVVLEALHERAALAPLDLNVHTYSAKWELLDALTRELGRNTLASLGAFAVPDTAADSDAVLVTCGIPALYRPIVGRWLDALVADGTLLEHAGGYCAGRALAVADLAALWERVDAALADNEPLLAYLRNCASLLTDVIAGRTSALETLFPAGSFDLATRLYEHSAVMRYVNGIAAAALAAQVARMPAEAAVRVLEFGAGTGGTTSSLLPALPASRTLYDYTDVSEIFLDHGKERFRDYPFVRTRLFDLEKDLDAQALSAGAYDVIIGSNVLHAATDLRAALGRVRSLLAPGGMLLLVESTGHLSWHDFSTGLIEGWQHFSDDLRQDTPLLAAGRWVELLREAGFAHVAAAPDDNSPAGVLKQHVLVAFQDGIAPALAPGVQEATHVHAPSAPSQPPAPDQPAVSDFMRRLSAAIPAERADVAVVAVRECVMEVLHSDPAQPPGRDARLMDLGVDSLMAVRLRNLLQKRLGLPGKLPATLIFDHPTITQIARLVVERANGKAAGSSEPQTQSRAARGREAEIAALTDEEAEAMLLSRLEAEGPS